MAPRNFLNPVLAKKAAREAARALVLSTKNLGEAHKALTRAAAELEFEYKGLDRDGSLLLYAAAVQQRDNCSTRLALLAAARRQTMSRRCGSGTVPVACGADQYGPARAPNNQWLLFHLARQGRPSSGRCCH